MSKRAETPQKSVELDRSRTPLILAGLLVVGIGLTAGAIAWGKSDAGEINVAATINNSNLDEAQRGETVQQSATAEHASLPNGGLVPAQGDANLPSPPPVAEETSTTTEPEAEADATDEIEGDSSSSTPEDIETSEAPAS